MGPRNAEASSLVSGSETHADMGLKEKIIASLKKYETDVDFSFSPALPKASVLIPLLLKDGQLRLVFNVRSLNVRNSGSHSLIIS